MTPPKLTAERLEDLRKRASNDIRDLLGHADALAREVEHRKELHGQAADATDDAKARETKLRKVLWDVAKAHHAGHYAGPVYNFDTCTLAACAMARAALSTPPAAAEKCPNCGSGDRRAHHAVSKGLAVSIPCSDSWHQNSAEFTAWASARPGRKPCILCADTGRRGNANGSTSPCSACAAEPGKGETWKPRYLCEWPDGCAKHRGTKHCARLEYEREIGGLKAQLAEAIERAKVDGEVFNQGRHEGRSDVAVALRKVVDPKDANHWNLDGSLAEVQRLKDALASTQRERDEARARLEAWEENSSAADWKHEAEEAATRIAELEKENGRLFVEHQASRGALKAVASAQEPHLCSYGVQQSLAKARIQRDEFEARLARVKEIVTKHCAYINGRCNSNRCVAHQILGDLAALSPTPQPEPAPDGGGKCDCHRVAIPHYRDLDCPKPTTPQHEVDATVMPIPWHLHVKVRDSLQRRLGVCVEALEEIADGNGCNSKYGPGCDTACKDIAHAAYRAARGEGDNG